MPGRRETAWQTGNVWLLALLGSVILHALFAFAILQVVLPDRPRPKRVVPVEPLTLTPGPAGRRGGGGSEPMEKPKPWPAPPPQVKPKPKPVLRPRKAVEPLPPETPPPSLAIPIPRRTPPPEPVKPIPESKTTAAASQAASAASGGGRSAGGSGGGSGAGVGVGPGSGVGAGRGTGAGGIGTGTGSALQAYLQQVRRLLERHKHYPPMARRQLQEGVVVLRFTIAASGRIESTGVNRSSGHSLLDQEAKETVHRVGVFPPFPPGLDRDRLTIEVPLAFRLSTSSD